MPCDYSDDDIEEDEDDIEDDDDDKDKDNSDHYSCNYGASKYYQKPGIDKDDWIKRPITRTLLNKFGNAMGIDTPTNWTPENGCEGTDDLYLHRDVIPYLSLWISPPHAKAIEVVFESMLQASDDLKAKDDSIAVLSAVIKKKTMIVRDLQDQIQSLKREINRNTPSDPALLVTDADAIQEQAASDQMVLFFEEDFWIDRMHFSVRMKEMLTAHVPA